MDVKATLNQYISSVMLHEVGPGTLGDDTPLIEGGIIDSMNLIKLVSFVEQAFGVKVLDEELDIDNFRSLEAITRFVERKKSPSGT